MRSARQPKEEPAPQRADLDAKAAGVLDGLQSVIAEIRDALRFAPAGDPQLPARMQQAAAAAYDAGGHVEDLRRQLKAYEEANASLEVAFQAGRAYERKLQDVPQVPRQSHRRTSGSRASGGWQQAVLTAVKVLVPAAAVGAWAALKGSVKAHRLATVALTATLPAAALGGALYTITPGSPGGSYGTSTAPAPAASVYGAVPAPSESLIATITRPKVKHGTKGKELDAAGLPVTCCWVAPEPSSSSSQSSSPSGQASAQAGTLSVSMTSVDLTASPQVTVELDASGAPVDWKAWCNSDDVLLDGGSTTSGTAAPGQPSYVTFSLAPVLDSLLGTTCHVWPGDFKIAVTIQAPAPVVSVSPLPTVLPSVLPSLSPSPGSS